MKLNYILSILILFLFVTSAYSQNIWDSVTQTAQMENEQNQDDSSASSVSQEEAEQWWNDFMETNRESLDFFKDDFDSCMAMMVLWVYEYEKLNDAIQSTGNCKMKYDYYGLQLLMITGSGTFMYCPERIGNSGFDIRARENSFFELFYKNYNDWLENDDTTLRLKVGPDHGLYPLAIKLGWLFMRIRNDQDYHQDGLLFAFILANYFTPQKVVGRIMAIGQAMEELGCG